MIDGYDFDHRLWQPPPVKPVRYPAYLLEQARQYEDNGGTPILNPRDVSERSLFNQDSVWMREKQLWRMWVKYFYDKKRPPPTPDK